MDTREITEELVALLEQNGVVIRREAMGGGGGGLCVIKEKKIFFVDTDCPIAEMNAICSRAVNELLDIESIYIRPQVRQYLEKYDICDK
ncbi:MAG: hypothetical protein K9M75_02855 [Phycisphaerae bacterium]|nr:hypothetical protein [Phycisphaerae bacterium]